MDRETIKELGLAIAELILRYGIPAAMDIVSTIDGDRPTKADIYALKLMVPPPESYLGER